VIKDYTILSPNEGFEMRSISGFQNGDPMRISKKLKPDASNVAISLASQTDSHGLTIRNSSETSDFVSRQRPQFD